MLGDWKSQAVLGQALPTSSINPRNLDASKEPPSIAFELFILR